MSLELICWWMAGWFLAKTPLGREQCCLIVHAQPHRFVADVDAALEQQILDVAQAKGKPDDIITTSRITSGDELKYRNGLAALLIRRIYRRRGPRAILL